MTLKIEKYGDKLVIPLPTDLAAQLMWGHGDILAAGVVENGLQIKRTMSATTTRLRLPIGVWKNTEKYLKLSLKAELRHRLTGWHGLLTALGRNLR
jgi:hypothetical protein